jgi:hypothetical protein
LNLSFHFKAHALDIIVGRIVDINSLAAARSCAENELAKPNFGQFAEYGKIAVSHFSSRNDEVIIESALSLL